MLKKISLRLRLSISIALTLIFCCLGLTLLLTYAGHRLLNNIIHYINDHIEMHNIVNNESIRFINESGTIIDIVKSNFRIISIWYMLFIILLGSFLAYLITKKTLKPLCNFNSEIKNISIHNLSQDIDVPPSNEEINDIINSFNDMIIRLNDSFTMQSTFSANVAHELRTPLAVLQNKIDVFNKYNAPTTGDYTNLLNSIEVQITKLTSLIGNLLDMTNFDDIEDNEEIPLKDLISDAIMELSPLAMKKNISIELSCDDIYINGNIDLLYRTFYNLIENGIKYNKSNGNILINAEYLGDFISIKFLDSGIGIPDNVKPLIFQPFYRVNKSLSRELGGLSLTGGAGLGLSIVKTIVDKYNGTISVSDNINEGSIFTITFPHISKI